MIDAVALRALLALADHRTVVAAARALGYTPSAVSQQLKRLEAQVGAELTSAAGRNVLLTQAGQTLAREGRDLLTRWSDLERVVAHLDGPSSGVVTVAAFPTAVRGLLIPAMVDLRAHAPGLTVRVVESEITPAIDAVRAGRYDAAIVHGWHGLATPVPDDLTSDPLGTDRADLVLRSDHPLADEKCLEPHQIVESVWAVQPPGTVCHRWFLHMFAGIGRIPREVWEVGEYETQLGLVRELGAVALIPRLGLDLDDPLLTRIPVDSPAPVRDIVLVSRPGFHATPLYGALLSSLMGRLAQ